MKYYLVAGEASGDLHGASLMKELLNNDPSAEFRYFGGDQMQQIGGTLVKHFREMAFMGVFDVLANIRTIKRNMSQCKKDILQFKPDALILIDYPGFNLRIAEFAKRNNIKVYYYISPKIWAWKERRVNKIKAFVDEMFTILPFETDFYKKHNYPVHYIGNPLIGKIEEHKKHVITKDGFLQKNQLDERPIVALVAGSRVGEIKLMLPVMLAMVQHFPGFQFVISGAPSISKDFYSKIIGEKKVPVLMDQTYDLIYHAHSALVTSGTATLETALFKIPQIMLYTFKGNKYLKRFIRKVFIKINLFSLPNLVLNKMAIRELVLEDMNQSRVLQELKLLLHNQEYRDGILNNYKQLKKLMGEAGAAKRAAIKMVKLLQL